MDSCRVGGQIYALKQHDECTDPSLADVDPQMNVTCKRVDRIAYRDKRQVGIDGDMRGQPDYRIVISHNRHWLVWQHVVSERVYHGLMFPWNFSREREANKLVGVLLE